MRIDKRPLFLFLALGTVFVAGCNTGAQNAAAPQLSASDQKKMAEASKQAQIEFESAQINHSNLPPDQKQRMLEQVRSSAGK